MARDVETILSAMRANPAGVTFSEACKVGDHFFGEFGKARTVGSHRIYKTPWPGDPRINIQKDGPKAKRYQVVQMIESIDKLKAIKAAQAAEVKRAVVPGKKGRGR